MKSFFRETTLVTTLAVVVLSVSPVVQAKDKKPVLLSGASAEMLANTCAGCHGDKGASNGPSIPTLAGMSSVYLVDMMEGYKSDEIPSTIMGRLAKGYTSEEFELMGKYFAAQTYVPVSQKSDAELAATGAKIHDKFCEKCHSEGGTVPDDESGFLKGQWRAYLSAQLMDYQNKDREASKKMAKKLKQMHEKHGDAGTRALIEYYSSNK